MPFFQAVDWETLQNVNPPFVPQPENDMDTGYFEGIARSNLSQSQSQLLNKLSLAFSTQHHATLEAVQLRRGGVQPRLKHALTFRSNMI